MGVKAQTYVRYLWKFEKEIDMIGQNIQHYRLMMGLTQAQLAEQAGVSEKTISNYENGQLKLIENRFQSIANVLNVDLSELFKK